MRFCLLCLSLWLPFSQVSWSQDGKNIINLSCFGSGSSVSVARQEAISGCKKDAANFLSKATTIRSLSIETEKNVALHSSVDEAVTVKNFNCKLLKEDIKKSNDLFEIKMQCQFDLSRAEVVADAKTPSEPPPASNGFFDDKVRKPAQQESGQYIESDEYPVTISAIPKCQDLIVKGARPRALKCNASPMTVVVHSLTDTEIIVRADGFIPKTIKLNHADRTRSFNVLLEN